MKRLLTLAVLATIGIVFAALYVLWVYQQTMQGPVRGRAVLDALERSPAGGPGAEVGRSSNPNHLVQVRG